MIALSIIAVNMFTGCTTVADAQRARGTGKKVTYQATFEKIWIAIPKAIEAAGLDYISSNRDDNSIVAQRGATPFSWGENVAIFVEKIEDNKSSVEVVSKRHLETNILAPNWANPIFNQLDKEFKRE